MQPCFMECKIINFVVFLCKRFIINMLTFQMDSMTPHLLMHNKKLTSPFISFFSFSFSSRLVAQSTVYLNKQRFLSIQDTYEGPMVTWACGCKSQSSLQLALTPSISKFSLFSMAEHITKKINVGEDMPHLTPKDHKEEM